MQLIASPSRNLLLTAVLVGVSVLVSLLAFAGWILHGPEIFLAMAQSGMSWCL